MTPEQRREQAEKEVREKLGWEIKGATLTRSPLWRPREIDLGAVYPLMQIYTTDAYNLAVSQTIALAEAQERIAELEKAIIQEHVGEYDKFRCLICDQLGHDLTPGAWGSLKHKPDCVLAALKGE